MVYDFRDTACSAAQIGGIPWFSWHARRSPLWKGEQGSHQYSGEVSVDPKSACSPCRLIEVSLQHLP